MEYRVTVTFGGLEGDEGAGERTLEALHRTHPEVGPVVSQNRDTGVLSVTIALDADGPAEVADRVRSIFADVARIAPLDPREVVAVDVHAVDAEELLVTGPLLA